jgi:radical SAM superfamily enzyme YgiQ (UPF0313 family)
MSYLHKDAGQVIEEIRESGANVVCFSLYIWNNDTSIEISKRVREEFGDDILILAGGPSVNITRDPEYIEKNSQFDYITYAQGEKPFYEILKHYFNDAKLSLLTMKNCGWVDEKGSVKKADYDFYRLTEGSPYIESRHLLEQVVNDAEYAGKTLSLPWESSKGCPYNCSFCDWTSGLSHKVSKRKFNYELEVELFEELGIFDLYFSDANFGLHKEDPEIMRVLVEAQKRVGGKFKIQSVNFSKNKKDVVYSLVEQAIEADLIINYKCSIQDIHEFILDNIERPDIPWDEHLVFINNLKKKFPNWVPCAEIIQGLPGQTRETWDALLNSLSENGFKTIIFKFLIISNAPASYDHEWRKRMEIQTDNVHVYQGQHNESVVATYSYNTDDYAYFTMTSAVYAEVQKWGQFIDPEYNAHVIGLYPKVLETLKQTPLYNDIFQLCCENYNDIPKCIDLTNYLLVKSMDVLPTLFPEHIGNQIEYYTSRNIEEL